MNIHNKKEIRESTLYIVPTPIGNLKDITERALLILNEVDIIATENTKRTKILLKYFNINTCLFLINNYNEKKRTKILVNKLKEGKTIALVSDAGTPLINDPGYCLVYNCHEIGIRVIPLPGPCAAITALSASGLSTNRFCYEGFLPKNHELRKKYIKSINTEVRTLIFYESKHRILDSLNDMLNILGPLRYMVLARELTKKWETILKSTIINVLNWVKENKTQQLGEIVIILDGYHSSKKNINPKILETLFLLEKELTFKKAITITSNIYKINKNLLYKSVIDHKTY